MYIIIRLLSLTILFTLINSCAKPPGFATDDNSQTTAQGLGDLKRFAGQMAGEYYTTSAPHNQIYLFNYDDSNFSAKYIPSLQAQAAYLKAHLGAKIMLAGHTDERGSREYNVALGERRAQAVATILRLEGVSLQQIRIVSYGKEKPVYLGHDESAHMQNRRVELHYEATR